MQSKIILISDDSDFFEYITPKLSLRKNDELYKLGFSQMPEKIHLLDCSILIVNSENRKQQTLDLLNIIEEQPLIVFGYNEDENFKVEALKKGMLAYFSPTTPDEELKAQIYTANKIVSLINKKGIYRNILVKNNLIEQNNEIYKDFVCVLDTALNNLKESASYATLVAIAPDEKSKFLIQQNLIETVILNHIRKNDLLMSYSPNKYFLLLNNTDLPTAKHVWKKISSFLPAGIHTGFSYVGHKKRQQIINEALNNLHTSINASTSENNFAGMNNNDNFKLIRQNFNKKLEKVISPVFYHIQQKYNDKLFNMEIEQGQGDGYGVLYIKSSDFVGTCRITSPGLSIINIDISFELLKNDNQNNTILSEKLKPKRINLEPEKFEEGLLQDILEQFINEFKELNEIIINV